MSAFSLAQLAALAASLSAARAVWRAPPRNRADLLALGMLSAGAVLASLAPA